MFDKILTWIANALMASILVVLSSQNAVFAQETDTSIPNGGDEPGKVIVPLTGTATARSVSGLEVAPTSFDTGVVEIGESVIENITLSHTGGDDSDPIAINSALLFGQNAQEYQADFNGFVTLYPGESTSFDVTFTPAVPGTKSAGLRLEIEGATAPYVLLFNGWSRYPLTSDLGISDNVIKMGQIVEGANTQKNLTFTNLGEADAPVINISDLQLGGDTPKAFSTDFTPSSIAPGESTTIKVTLSSGDAGFKSTDVVITHDGNNPDVETRFEGTVVAPKAVPINFGKSVLKNASMERATSLQFGPDGKLYVAEMDGLIHVYNITRNGKNNYTANKFETISGIQNTQNHNDDGSVNNGLKTRLLTGMLVTGAAGNPIIYAASSDPRQAAGPSGNDSNLDTNSGILHKLTRNGGAWTKQNLVRGLPRSEENHVANGLVMYGNKILLSVGGHTNMGVPSNNFAELAEYALSAAILEIDINSINGTHDLPTLDDEDRPGANDANDPFGGNDGKNQAKLVANSPVSLFSTGYRNAYDIVLTESGKLYTFDNGPNPGWGGTPGGNCANNIDNGGALHFDNLHLVSKNSYGGHPNPTRGSKNNKFNGGNNAQSPMEIAARPAECDYKGPGNDGSLTTIGSSSNGLAEYTASNFAGAMQGDLLVATFKKSIFRIELNNAGTKVTSKSQLFTGLGTVPLDVIAQGDNDPFPGTVWVADNLDNGITVFEPSDY